MEISSLFGLVKEVLSLGRRFVEACVLIEGLLQITRIIDLTHNDVKQCFCGSNVHYGSCSHARIQFGVVFLRSGKFKWQ